MARKLYMFIPVGRLRVEGTSKAEFKWVGGYSTSYAYLGDYFARKLGVGDRLLNLNQQLPAWMQGQAVDAKESKGGASRHDPSFRGWG